VIDESTPWCGGVWVVKNVRPDCHAHSPLGPFACFRSLATQGPVFALQLMWSERWRGFSLFVLAESVASLLGRVRLLSGTPLLVEKWCVLLSV